MNEVSFSVSRNAKYTPLLQVVSYMREMLTASGQPGGRAYVVAGAAMLVVAADVVLGRCAAEAKEIA